jgi:hypothetical protein
MLAATCRGSNFPSDAAAALAAAFCCFLLGLWDSMRLYSNAVDARNCLAASAVSVSGAFGWSKPSQMFSAHTQQAAPPRQQACQQVSCTNANISFGGHKPSSLLVQPQTNCLQQLSPSSELAAAAERRQAASAEPRAPCVVQQCSLGNSQSTCSACSCCCSPFSHAHSRWSMRSGHQGYVLHCSGRTLCMLQVLSGCRKMQSRAYNSRHTLVNCLQ